MPKRLLSVVTPRTPMKRARSSGKARLRKVALPQETKYYETQVFNSSVTTTAAIYCLNTVDAGDAFNQRNGRQILHKYVQYNCSIRCASSAPIPSRWDMYFVLDRQANAVTAAIQDIFDVSTITAPNYMKNIKANQDRFKILKHETGWVSNGSAENLNVSGYIDLSKTNFRDRMVRYFTDGGAPVPTTNAILVVLMSDSSTASYVTALCGFRYAFVE